jgi:HSP20 family molecular chaperone IbpA
MAMSMAKTYIGKNVNIHLKDGSVIINVRIENVIKDKEINRKFLEYSYKDKKEVIELHKIAWLEEVFVCHQAI